MKSWRARAGSVCCIVAAAAIAVTCVRSDAERCGDDVVCAAGLSCHRPAEDMVTCVSAEQLEICEGQPNGVECSVEGVAGTCFAGACYVQRCGDNLQDVTEVCDEGDVEPGSGCSADCQSAEVCGNN